MDDSASAPSVEECLSSVRVLKPAPQRALCVRQTEQFPMRAPVTITMIARTTQEATSCSGSASVAWPIITPAMFHVKQSKTDAGRQRRCHSRLMALRKGRFHGRVPSRA